MITFTIDGHPMTWTRTRFGRSGQFFVPDDRKGRMAEIRDSWKALGVEPYERGVYIAIAAHFVFHRPDGHYGTGRNAGVMKDRMRAARPGLGKYGGDLDNLLKLVKDALNAVAFHDDSQIVEYGRVGKFYIAGRREDLFGRSLPLDEMPHTEVALWAVDEAGIVPAQETLLAPAG